MQGSLKEKKSQQCLLGQDGSPRNQGKTYQDIFIPLIKGMASEQCMLFRLIGWLHVGSESNVDRRLVRYLQAQPRQGDSDRYEYCTEYCSYVVATGQANR